MPQSPNIRFVTETDLVDAINAAVADLEDELALKASIVATPVIVQYDDDTDTWPTFDVTPTRVRFFISVGSADATAPTHYNGHDLWFAHPDAV